MADIDIDIDSDDDFENVDLADYDLNYSEGTVSGQIDDTPASTPPSTSTTSARQPGKSFPCPWENCHKSFNRQARLKEHLRSHTNTRPFKCPYVPCTKAFLRDSHLKHHVKSQHVKLRDHPCTFEGCDKSFVTATRLRRHVETHQDKDRFRCNHPDCDQTFRKQGTLDRHILSFHKNIKPFPCEETDSVTGQPCTKAYDTAEKLRTHQRAKHDPSRFSCDDCKELNEAHRASGQFDRIVVAYFPTYGEFQAHLKIVHPPTCSHCPTSFTTNKELTRHLEIQHGILLPTSSKKAPSFPCTHGCGKVFTKRGNLNVHVKTVHENSRDFVCGKTEVALPDELQNQEDLVVEGCNRGFTTKASLEEHIRTAHLGLESKRMIREKKRKAEQSVDEGPASVPRKRKARKDKGARKTSAIDGLVGGPGKQEDFLYYGLGDYDHGDVDNVSDNDEALSGSMTMLGDEIYHSGNAYHYLSGEYPTSNPPNSLATSKQSNTHATRADDLADDNIFPFEDYNFNGPSDYIVNDDFYGAFEQHTLDPL
ncbi:uncharacterized protein A1O9_05022 [Exophiala aquamarina CBS 119918]|uniref:C2H2-type domain-containing protein n=1 Tax=Exophiala aquamarina CBS 119918 TaxID=1182545 RepID=A0A072PK84_9EURO|nr:uncharacterized protein A1O9_05022 [Exophiala aquamarina CBS 119918]KEF60172.1 hypothetical protein A1O9_05022 [Exophiala aquamarina CBS 119918]